MNTAPPHAKQREHRSAPTVAALLDILPDAAVTGPTGIAVADVRFDSRQVQPGDLFVAISHPGYQHDGHNFVSSALDRGAVGVIVGRPVAVPADVVQVVVQDPPRALALLSAARAGWPAARLGIVGVTGTDGKTTTTTLIAGALQALGHTAAHVSTVSLGTGAAAQPNKSRQSTPEAPEIQHLLAQATDHGADYAVIEATSHGLAQDRLYGTEVDVAVYTNITHEHLDYHGSIEEYVAAKARLLALQSRLPGVPAKLHPRAKAAVLNADDAHCAHLRSLAQVPVTTYGLLRPADVHAVSATYDGLRPSVQVRTPWGSAQLRPRVVGPFNVANVLAALTILGVLGCPFEAAVAALCQTAGAPGRMELIEAGQPFTVIVDYAHTPASLDLLLRALRPLTPGRLIAVFGSAGERDRAKRPMMGRIAATHVDFFVLTDEDPRGEDRETILAEIAAGAAAAGARQGTHFLCCPDRRAAIRLAFERAEAGDTVLLAGKGHEQSIIVNGRSQPWDDRAVARALLS